MFKKAGFEHFGCYRCRNGTRKRVATICRAMRADNPDLVLITGDLVHIGLEHEFREARTWLESVGPPSQVRLVPGNHDCYHRESWTHAKRWYGDYLAGTQGAHFPAVETHAAATLVLASSAHPAPWWGAIGTLGAEQRQLIGAALAAHQSELRILALHHPPLPNTCSWRKALTDAKQLESILKQGRPHITLHGHLHHNTEHRTEYGRIYCTASAANSGESAPASYRIFDIHADGMRWQVAMQLKVLRSGTLACTEQDNFEVRN